VSHHRRAAGGERQVLIVRSRRRLLPDRFIRSPAAPCGRKGAARRIARRNICV